MPSPERPSFRPSGRIVPEAQTASVREVLLGNYRIIYRIREVSIDILAIYHSVRLLDVRRIEDPGQ